MEDGIQSAGTAHAAAPRVERVQVERGIAGWHLVPAEPAYHPLLARLFGPDAQGNPPGPVVRPGDRKPLQWASLSEGLDEIRAVAKDCAVALRVCGDIRRRPTLLLWERSPDPKSAEPVLRPFDDLGGTFAGQWSIADFYERHAQALAAALASGAPFDTGSFGCKKEIQFGRIRRERRNGVVRIEVSVEMDEWADLVDTALWRAYGKRLDAGSGAGVLEKLGLDEDEAIAWMEAEADQEAARAAPGADRITSRCATLARNVGFEPLRERLDALADQCESELANVFAGLVEHCAARLVDWKRERGASCFNCRFFHPATGASKASPEDPAACGHPKYYALLSANKRFPFEHGCRFWQAEAARRHR